MATDLVTRLAHYDGTPEDHKLVQDMKRDADKRHKYAHGVLDRDDPRDGGRPSKPNGPLSKRTTRALKRQVAKDPHSVNAATVKKLGKRRPGLNADDLLDTTSGDGLSTDESIREPSPAPDPEAEITYSFDAPRGASKGGEVLGEAVTQAVERFETRETQKLVDREYEVVSDDGDEAEGGRGGYDADDDFELV